MRFVLAPQEFKGSLTAREAVVAMEDGIRRCLPDAAVDRVPMADGGPGMVDALTAARGGELRVARVHDPLGRPVDAVYGLVDNGRLAVIEMAAASGLSLLERSELDPLRASSDGTGELIRFALDAGAREFIIGIGGSATNDGGVGMASALGIRFLDAEGQPLPPGGEALARLASIDSRMCDPRLAESRFLAACDVSNPLCGPQGASAIYGPQKGATPEIVLRLDAALRRLAEVIARDLGTDVVDLPGSGAAGGLGAGLVAFLGAELRPGFPLIAAAARLAQRIRGADLVLTGEGRLDLQTAFGKTVAGVAAVAAEEGVPVITLAGGLSAGFEQALAAGIAAAFSIVPGPATLAEAEAHAVEYLSRATESVVRAVLVGHRLGRGSHSAA